LLKELEIFRPHQAMNNQFPTAAWHAGMDRIEAAKTVDIPAVKIIHTRTGLFRICGRPISAITRRRAQAASAYPAVAKSRLRPFAEVEPFRSIAPSNFTFDGVRMYLTSSFGEIRCCAAAVSQI
jgi:hypothetical protein